MIVTVTYDHDQPRPRVDEIVWYHTEADRIGVCADERIKRSEIREAMRAETGDRWRVPKRPFPTGESNPCQCQEHEGRRLHYWLERIR